MITPMDIHNKTFSGQIRGYSKDEVNACLLYTSPSPRD